MNRVSECWFGKSFVSHKSSQSTHEPRAGRITGETQSQWMRGLYTLIKIRKSVITLPNFRIGRYIEELRIVMGAR